MYEVLPAETGDQAIRALRSKVEAAGFAVYDCESGGDAFESEDSEWRVKAMFVLHEAAASSWCDERWYVVEDNTDIPPLIAGALAGNLITGDEGVDLAVDVVADDDGELDGVRVLVEIVHGYWLASPILRLASHPPVSDTSLHDEVGVMSTVVKVANAMLTDFAERTSPARHTRT